MQNQTYSNNYNYPVSTLSIRPTAVLNTGIFGTVIGSTVAMGLNLHKVQSEEMSISEALTDSLAKGAGAGLAAATATAAAQAIGGGRVTNWAVMLATATGVGYAINMLGRKNDADGKK